MGDTSVVTHLYILVKVPVTAAPPYTVHACTLDLPQSRLLGATMFGVMRPTMEHDNDWAIAPHLPVHYVD